MINRVDIRENIVSMFIQVISDSFVIKIFGSIVIVQIIVYLFSVSGMYLFVI